jgi:hypothetical protein
MALGVYAITHAPLAGDEQDRRRAASLGIATPPLLLNHADRHAHGGEVTPNFDATFGQMLAVYWSFSPGYACSSCWL